MEITLEVLEKELESLTKQREQFVANINQIAGAISMTENLIKKKKEVKETKEDKKDGKDK
jgi:hypothetical protein